MIKIKKSPLDAAGPEYGISGQNLRLMNKLNGVGPVDNRPSTD